jgi:hypothetical protein
MNRDNGDFLLSIEELPALAELAGARSNPLSLIPRQDKPYAQLESLTAQFKQLDATEQRHVGVALAILRAPAKIAIIHHTIADESISRGQLAWSHSLPDSIVALANSGDTRRLSYWSESGISASLKKILAADQPLSDDEIGCKLSPPAVITFLAVLDHLRYARLYSILTHGLPTTSFSPAEVVDRLASASQEDFRWPLLFLEKVTPGGMVSSLTEPEVSAALQELIAARLIEPVVETEQSRRYELLETGKIICDGVLHDVSKVAICISELNSAGQACFDIMLLVRSSFHLFMFAMAGNTGAVAALDNNEFDEILHNLLSLRAPEQPVQPAPQEPAVAEDTRQAPPVTVAPEPQALFCPKCRVPFTAGDNFCGACGARLG